MHLSEDVLQTYLDHESSEQDSAQIKQHLTNCDTCRSALSQLQQRSESNRSRLNSVTPEITPDADALLAQIQSRHIDNAIPKKSHWRSFLAAAVAIAALTTAFYFQPVRGWATEFLSLFRVQQVAVLRFDPANLQQLNSGLYGDDSERRIEQLLSDTVHVERRGEPKDFQNANDAARAAGFGIQMPTLLQPSTRIRVQPAIEAQFDIDVERLQGILDDAGRSDIKIPEEINGETIRVNVPASVTTFFGSCPDPQEMKKGNRRQQFRKFKDCKVLVQLPSPTVVAPPSLNVNELATQMMKLLGLKEEEARSFSESIDWATTLVIPIPIDPRVNVTEVNINGAKGYSFIKGDPGTDSEVAYNLLWIRDGIVYSLMGQGTVDQSIAIANSI
jgi:uncharacterized protein DUF4367/putative zinc finger protein